MKKYYPILLAKKGEFDALSNLSPTAKQELAPIIQVVPTSLSKLFQFCTTHWSFAGSELIVDFEHLQAMGLDHRLDYILELMRPVEKVGLVVSINSTDDELARINSFCQNNVALNLYLRVDLYAPWLNLQGRIIEVVQKLDLDGQSISALINLGLIDERNQIMMARNAVNLYQAINSISAFETIIISSGSFPENLTKLKPGQTHILERREMAVWEQVNHVLGYPSDLRYADFGVKHPVYSDSAYLGSCSVKYSTANEYVVFRGELSMNHIDGNGQYITHSIALVSHHLYYGPNFSWGDSRIQFYSQQSLSDVNAKKGNATTWVAISQNHHLMMVLGWL